MFDLFIAAGAGQSPYAASAQLAEGEREGLDVPIQELDLKQAINDRLRLPDELIRARLSHYAISRAVEVGPASGACGLSIQKYPESSGSFLNWRRHDQVKIARMKAVGDPSVGLVQRNVLPPHRPVARERPVVQIQSSRGGIRVSLIKNHPAGRREILSLIVADVVLSGLQIAPIGGSFDPASIERDQLAANTASAGL